MVEYQKKVLAVVGPTASGKTKLSIELAKTLNGEIVSADSMQIYKGMNIGTAKPTEFELCLVKHHLVDFLDPKEKFSVAQYVSLAKKCIEDICSRGKTPVVCGGTGLYVDSLLNNIVFTKSDSNYELRKNLMEQGKKFGGQFLIEKLAEFDPEMAKDVHPNNLKRLVRAIEIYHTTGKTMSEHIKESRKIPSPYDSLIIGLNFQDRNVLYERINKRVDQMIESGLEKEAIEILNKGVDITALSAIGYKEMLGYINGDYDFDFAVELIKKNTRHYAKRQITWFKRNQSVNWIYVDCYENFNNVLTAAKKIINDRRF